MLFALANRLRNMAFEQRPRRKARAFVVDIAPIVPMCKQYQSKARLESLEFAYAR